VTSDSIVAESAARVVRRYTSGLDHPSARHQDGIVFHVVLSWRQRGNVEECNEAVSCCLHIRVDHAL
jgi:hypothetical protein